MFETVPEPDGNIYQENLASIAAVVLAAGKGTRMKTSLPKVLHPILGEPMLGHTLRSLREAGIPPERTVIVVGYGAELVQKAAGRYGPYLAVEQNPQLGTAHAVRQAQPLLEELTNQSPGAAEQILIVYGDGPLLRPETLQTLFSHHFRINPLVTMLTVESDDPTGYGRIIRDLSSGRFRNIVEEPDLTPAQKTIREWNPGIYLCRSKWLWPALARVPKNPRKGEYYLTDVPAFAVEEAQPGKPFPVQTQPVAKEEVLGINDRVQLGDAIEILRQRILEKWMLAGVTITDPANTYIGAEAVLEQDCVVEPNTHIKGACWIGRNSIIGPNSILEDTRVGENCRVLASVLESAILEDEVSIGPFSHLRPGAYLERGVHLGNFAEVNRSRLGTGTKQGHFSYIGDAMVGPDTNIGAGTITANYDGMRKNKTSIGKGVKLGSDTILVAPVTVGDEAITGAGSVVTHDVAPGATVAGVPAKPLNKKL